MILECVEGPRPILFRGMTPVADVTFLAGPIGAVVHVPLALTLLAIAKRPRWALWLGGTLSAVVALTWMTYWFLWGKAFNYADANRPVPVTIDTASNVSMVLCAISGVALAGTGIIAFSASRHHHQQHPQPVTTAELGLGQ